MAIAKKSATFKNADVKVAGDVDQGRDSNV